VTAAFNPTSTTTNSTLTFTVATNATLGTTNVIITGTNGSLTHTTTISLLVKGIVSISSGLTANNKVYDGTTTATISSNNVGLSGVMATDTNNVKLSTNGYTAIFASATAGNGKTVTVSGLTLTGSAAANYTLTQPNPTANITAASTLTAVISSLNPALPGSNVTFTATVSVVAPGGGTPTGNVIFKDGANALGTNALNGSAVASFSSTLLSHGSHTITAGYAGDGNFSGSTNSLSQVINAPPVTASDTRQRSLNAGLKIRIATLLTNDIDPDGDALTFVSVATTSASGGTNTVHGPWITYAPPAGFTNADSFSYIMADSGGLQVTGTVFITILADSAPAQNVGGIDQLGNNSARIHFNAIPGRTYTIQYATNLVTPTWLPLGTATADAFGKADFTNSPATNSPPRFYRSISP